MLHPRHRTLPLTVSNDSNRSLCSVTFCSVGLYFDMLILSLETTGGKRGGRGEKMRGLIRNSMY